jgi:hypothetical protein
MKAPRSESQVARPLEESSEAAKAGAHLRWIKIIRNSTSAEEHDSQLNQALEDPEVIKDRQAAASVNPNS